MLSSTSRSMFKPEMVNVCYANSGASEKVTMSPAVKWNSEGEKVNGPLPSPSSKAISTTE